MLCYLEPGGECDNEGKNHIESLTAFVCHDNDRCDGAKSFRIKNLDGYQVLRVNVQVVDFMVLWRNAREEAGEIKIMKVIISIPGTVGFFFPAPFMLSGYK